MADSKAYYNKMRAVVGEQVGDKGTEYIGKCLLAGSALIAEAIRNSIEIGDPIETSKECLSCHKILQETCKNIQCREYKGDK